MDFYGWLWSLLWPRQWVRRVLVFLVAHERSPGWLVNWVWHWTPFGHAMRLMHLEAGEFDKAAECAKLLARHGRGGLGRA